MFHNRPLFLVSTKLKRLPPQGCCISSDQWFETRGVYRGLI